METFRSAADATATVCTALDRRYPRRSPRHLGAAMTPIDLWCFRTPRFLAILWLGPKPAPLSNRDRIAEKTIVSIRDFMIAVETAAEITVTMLDSIEETMLRVIKTLNEDAP
jgi:hypothetical protein